MSTTLEQALTLLSSDDVHDWRKATAVLRDELEANPSWDRGQLLLGQAQVSRSGSYAGIREAASANLGVCLGKVIPRHQLAWMNDPERTRVWAAALASLAASGRAAEGCSAEGARVLVGGSTGPAAAVHAMIAAGQGQGHFQTVVGSAFGAASATAAVAANALAERITVTATDCGAGPFSAIAWDFGGSIDELALRRFVAARAQMSGQSAAALPVAIVVRAALVQSETLCSLNGLDGGLVRVTEDTAKAVGGTLEPLNGAQGLFDLQDFERAYTRAQRPCQLQGLIVNEGEEPAWRFVSDIQDVLRIQTDRLYNEADCTGIHGDWVDLTASASADACVTIVYWIDVHLGGDAVLSNEPPGVGGAPGNLAELWAVQRAAFAPPHANGWATTAGSKVRLRAALGESSAEGVTFEVDFGTGLVRAGRSSGAEASLLAPATASDVDLDGSADQPAAAPAADPLLLPDYHFSMLNDAERNAAYMLGVAAAVRRAAQRGGGAPPAVMDIGAGSGLLSIMAQRAGAGTVVAVERDETLAEVASAVVDRNGAGEVVCVVAANSKDIEVPSEGRFDVIVSEILGSDPLSEGVLQTLRHASEHLLAPDGEFVPSRIILRAALASSGPVLSATMRAHGPGGGLDFEAFAHLEPLRVSVHGPHASRLGFRVRTSAASFPVDLSGRPPAVSGVVAGTVCGLEDGEADCVIYWFEVDFGGGVLMSAGPEAGYRSHWSQTMHPLLPAGTRKGIKQGEVISMEARFSLERLVFLLKK